MVLHTLGLRLGKTLAELDEMECAELTSWLAFFELYPGAVRA